MSVNIFFDFFKEHFSTKEKKSASNLLFLFIFAAAFETLTLGSLLPVMAILSGSGGEGGLPSFLAQKSHYEIVYILCLGLLLMFTLKTLFLCWFLKVQSVFAYRLMARISNEIFLFYSASAIIIDPARDNSKIIRNVMREPNFLVGGVVLPILIIGTELTIVFGVSVFLIFYAPVATLSSTIFLGSVGGLFLRLSGFRLSKLGEQVQMGESLRFREVGNLISGAKDLFLVNMCQVYYERFHQQTLNLSEKLSKQYLFKHGSKIFLEFFAIAAIVGLIIVFVAVGDSLSDILSQVTVYLVALFRILPAANRIVVNINTISFNCATLSVVSDELKKLAKSKLEYRAMDGSLDHENWMKFSLRNVSFHYPSCHINAVTALSFDVAKGEKIAIFGASGSGKTTLVDILLGLQKVNSGGIFFTNDGTEKLVQGLPRKLVGYVPQKVFLFEGSIEQNITLEDFHRSVVDVYRLHAAIEKAGLTEFVKMLPKGVKSTVGEDGSALSGGQLQRIGLARALYREPEILILDEATTGLDWVTEEKIFNVLLQIRDLTILCVSHNVDLASKFTRIIELPSRDHVQTELAP